MASPEWEKPKAVVIPKDTGDLQQGKYGPIFPKTPACYGFTIIAKVKAGTAEAIRNYANRLAKAVEGDPYVLAPLKLHYLRWVLFDNDTRFMYQGIFDTDFDKYTEDAIALFTKTGINTVFENLEDFPADWKTSGATNVQFTSGFWNTIGSGIITVFNPSNVVIATLTDTSLGIDTFNLTALGTIGHITFDSRLDPAGADIDNLQFQTPEPSSFLLIGAGLFALGTRRLLKLLR